MEKNLIILGAGGHGRVVKEAAEAMNVFDKIDFLDDNSEMAIGKLNAISEISKEYKYAFVAIGSNELRMEWIKRIEELGYILPVLIHPRAIVSPSASVYPGTIVTMGALVQTNVVIEKGCIVGSGTIIDHDSFIGYGTHIDSGAIVKSNCIVMSNKKVESGMIVTKKDLPTPNDFLKSKGF
ncbi:MAG: PglB [Vallitaleaceae bacterium]|nr:PglB [Vallitaleaceae bacterium]